MICIEQKEWDSLRKIDNLEYSLIAINSKFLLGDTSPYLLLQSSLFEENPEVAEYLMDELNIPLVDIFFATGIH